MWVWHVGVVCPGFDFPKVGGYNYYACGGGYGGACKPGGPNSLIILDYTNM